MAIVTEDRTPAMEAQFPATPEATEGQMSDAQLIAEMLAGLEGTTDCLWYPGHLANDEHSCDCRYVFAEDDRMGSVATVNMDDGGEFGSEYPSREEAKRNLAHIARCSPYNIRRLLTRARSAHADIEAGAPAGDAVAEAFADGVFWYKPAMEHWFPDGTKFYTHPSPPIDGLVERAVTEFAQAILHGDTEHREWLMSAAVAFNAGQPLPPPNGKGRAEAAEAAVGVLTTALQEAEAGLEFAGADRIIPDGDFVPAPTLALRIVRAALSQAQPTAPGANSTNKASS